MAKLSVKSFTDREEAKARYQNEIDAYAEVIRRRYITSSPGQSMAYEAKYQEAVRYPSTPPFPFIESEARVTGQSTEEVVAKILKARARWLEIGAEIEALRIDGKIRIRAATTAAEMHEISSEVIRSIKMLRHT